MLIFTGIPTRAQDSHGKWMDDAGGDPAPKQSEKIALGVVSIVGGTLLSLVGLVQPLLIKQNCEQGPSGFTECYEDKADARHKAVLGNVLVFSGLGLIGVGIYEIAKD